MDKFKIKKTKSSSVYKRVFMTSTLVCGLFALGLNVFVPSSSSPSANALSLKPNTEPSISLDTSSSNVDFGSITPNSPTVNTTGLIASVSTESTNGYKMFLSTSDSNTCMREWQSASLACGSVDASSKILAGNPNSTTNTWGWSNNSGSSWITPQDSSSAVTFATRTDGPYTDDETDITFGAKVNTNLIASGHYGSEVVISALAEPMEIATITNVSPSTGEINTITNITISGTNFDTAYQVFIDLNANGDQDSGEECSNVNIASNGNSLTCDVPTHNTATSFNVVVKNWGGTATKTNGFTYTLPKPIVTSISPNSGHFRGGETFMITGKNLTGATAVSFGTSACRSFEVISDTSIKCVSSGVDTDLQTVDAYGAGSYMTNATNIMSVNVTTPLGTNNSNSLFTYRYSNSSFANGGSYVETIGTDLTLGSKLSIGGTNCKDQKITSSNTGACISPTKTLGNQNLVITAPNASSGNLQNFSAACTSPYGTIRTLTDTRDGQNYRVRCMEDGKWWMIDNLKLELTNGMTLTSSTTNVSSNTTVYFTQDGTSTGTAMTGMTGNFTTSGYMTRDGVSSSTSPNYDAWRQADPATASTLAAWICNNQIKINKDSLTNCGYFYNYYTATAGSRPQASGAGYATSSICPAGWHMPYNTATNDLGVLNASMLNGSPSASSTTNSATTRPNWRYNGKFQGSLSGVYNSGFNSQGSSGRYWSARANSATAVYHLSFSHSDLGVGSSGVTEKSLGASVRCMI